jgi:hypothetical protein
MKNKKSEEFSLQKFLEKSFDKNRSKILEKKFRHKSEKKFF